METMETISERNRKLVLNSCNFSQPQSSFQHQPELVESLMFPNRHELLRALRKYSDKQLEEVTQRLKAERRKKKKKKKFILCRSCNHIITSVDKRIEVSGQHSHVFKNPAGIVYRIGCFSAATGCFNFGDPTEQFTWFPGYAWCYSNCLNCFMHLGWFYQSGEDNFYGLILSHLIEGEKERSN